VLMYSVCRRWTRKPNTAAKNGVFFGWTTESECMAACLMSPSCVAIDVGLVGCLLQYNVTDLTTIHYAPGVTHSVLNRSCPSPSPLSTERLSTESPSTTTSSVQDTTGMS